MIFSTDPDSETECFLSNVEVVLSFLPQIQLPVWMLLTLLKSVKQEALVSDTG